MPSGDQIAENSRENGEQHADLKRDRDKSRPRKFRTPADVERIADRVRINFHPETGCGAKQSRDEDNQRQ